MTRFANRLIDFLIGLDCPPLRSLEERCPRIHDRWIRDRDENFEMLEESLRGEYEGW
jgi:hypothetical protein